MKQDYSEEIPEEIRVLLKEVDKRKEDLNDLTISIAEIAAPPFNETRRGKFIKEKFEQIGLITEIDNIGNVIAYKDLEAKTGIILSAHLDTVFPDKKIKITREGDKLHGPGVGDDSRGLANLLLIAELLFPTPYANHILFVATVGEEGRGDLRGVKHLFSNEEHQNIHPKCFVSIDGTGVTDIVDQGVGSLRYRIHFYGPGGHSYGSFGTVNPSYSLAGFIQKFSKITLNGSHKSSFNVGKIGGGTAINAIPEDVWVDIDMRSTSVEELTKMDELIKKFAYSAIEAENKIREGEITIDFEKVGDRPAGKLAKESWLRDCIKICHDHLGLDYNFTPSSTDANVPLNKHIPAITVASVQKAGRAHTYNEWIDGSVNSLIPVKRNLLLVIIIAQYK